MSRLLQGTDDVVAAVPGPRADRDDVAGWLGSTTVHACPTVATLPTAADLRGTRWYELLETAAFWEEQGVGSLTSAMAAVLSTCWTTATDLVVLVHAGRSGLRYLVGMDGPQADAGAHVLGSQLPGSSWVGLDAVADPEVGRVLAPSGNRVPVAAFAGRPRATCSPADVPLVERLADLGLDGWTWTTVFAPAPIDRIADRTARVHHLADVLAAQTGRSVMVSDTETASLQDPTAQRLTAMVLDELAHCERAGAEGGFTMVSYLLIEADVTKDRSTTVAATALGCIAEHARPGPGISDDTARVSTPVRPLRAREIVHGVPASFVSATDGASLVQPPLHDVFGIPSRAWARFDRHAEPVARTIGEPMVEIGSLLGRVDGRVAVPASSLTKHTLINGVTGAGKSALLAAILHQLHAAGIPFLVIEPSKDEYQHLDIPGLQVWHVGDPYSAQLWPLNPLEVPSGTPVALHMDLVRALVRVSFGLFPPFPFVVERALQRSYEERGWDLISGTNARAGTCEPSLLWPTWADLVRHCLAVVDKQGYQGEVRANVLAAADIRMGSLLEGPKGECFDTEAIFPLDEVFGRPTVVNLDRVGDDDAKAFVIGLLMIRLFELRRDKPTRGLRHVAVLEEAHRLLGGSAPATPSDADHGTIDPGAFAASTFVNMLAEIRSAGEGLIVCDQRVEHLDRGVVANTGTKVVLRTFDGADQRTLADSMGLPAEAARRFTSLRDHDAAVFYEGMDRPVLIRTNHRFGSATPPATNRRVPFRPPPDVGRDRLLHRLVRTTGDEAAATLTALRRSVASELPDGVGATDVDGVIRTMVTDLVHRLGRSRRWTQATRSAAVNAALRGTDEANHPARLLLDGRTMDLACDAACPGGGCLAGELTTPLVQRIRHERVFDLAEMSRDPERVRRRVRREVRALVGRSHGDATLDEVVATCLAARVLDAQTDDETIAEVLVELAPIVRKEAA